VTTPARQVSYLVDTNVLSELRKRQRADPLVLGWFWRRRPEELFVSVLTLGELRRGAERIRRRDPQAAEALSRWIDLISDRFQDRVLTIDRAVAELWGRLGVPDPLPDVDALIAATAIARNLVVVTRNVRHFSRANVRFLDPFDPNSEAD